MPRQNPGAYFFCLSTSSAPMRARLRTMAERDSSAFGQIWLAALMSKARSDSDILTVTGMVRFTGRVSARILLTSKDTKCTLYHQCAPTHTY